ncbi:hypothetical protein BIT28_07105 [Photobacterium proteolyticum]|uniref:HTH luxR-type domain-containing protein n=1 Tax=Photobacterium proteolyticum TaxID=1903952 RepID=A0A1Q9GF12_9GAMM|nr:helix-turn-helix transcriptional regulator [Photobacterium proteolyticum]OLQ72944.1 hypothetical protein BIT28_07105 [Photobacterium proteolyticum]
MTKIEQIKLTNFCEENKKKIRENAIHKLIINYCQSNRIPALWGNVHNPRQNHYYFNYISDRKLRTMPPSFTIPIHSSIGKTGTISFSLCEKNNNDQSLFFYAASLVQTVIPYLHDKIDDATVTNKVDTCNLTKRETETLTWATEGKSAWEISRILSCSERTVTFHLQNACNKLGASNKYQAISKGILSGMIFPNTPY